MFEYIWCRFSTILPTSRCSHWS